MFQRFQEKREEREGGFTLIELLVVIIIIAILAAIAIPVFLKQREKGWKSQAESAVKNAATAIESWGTENGGSYVGACGGASATSCAAFDTTASNNLTGNGLKMAPAVNLAVIEADAAGYCLHATHDNLSSYNVYFSSASGAPSTTACTTATQ
jgi:type IV pilus assembly protein PilA